MDETVREPGPMDRSKTAEAIEHICAYFDERGLSLVERWHVCESIELAALNIMGGKLREACEKLKDADIESLSSRTDA